jgi:hypothetical protein
VIFVWEAAFVAQSGGMPFFWDGFGTGGSFPVGTGGGTPTVTDWVTPFRRRRR